MKKEKKAISVIVSYVLLIALSVAIAGLVYTWLSSYSREIIQKENCPDVSVVFSYNCYYNNIENRKEINLTFENKGLFNVSGVLLKFSVRENSATSYFFGDSPEIKFDSDLSPGEKKTRIFDYSDYKNIKKIEIEPFIFKNNKKILCPKAVVEMNVDC